MDYIKILSNCIPSKSLRTSAREFLRFTLERRRDRETLKDFFNRSHSYTVLLVLHDLHVGGAQIAALQFARTVIADGGSVFVAAFAPGAMVADFTAAGAVCVADGLYKKNRFAIRRMTESFDHIVLNTVVCHEWANALVGDLRAVWWLHEAHLVDAYLQEGDKDFTRYQKALREFTRIYVVSEYAGAFLRKYNSAFSILAPTVEDVPPKQAPPRTDGKVRFAVIGPFCDNKGQKVMLEALFSLEPEARQQAKVYFVGGPEGEDYSYIAERVKKEPSVTILSERMGQGEKHDIYSGMDVICVVSKHESFSLVVLEACMLGKPLIVTTTVGANFMVQDGVNGFHIPSGDAAALARAMLWFINNPGAIKSMGERSRRLYLEYAPTARFKRGVFELLGRGECVALNTSAAEGTQCPRP